MPNHTQKQFWRVENTFSDHSGSVNCILGHRLLSFLLLMLLACTRRRHSRHAKPYPKVISERRKHLFGSLGECELHSGPPIALLPTAHASCLHRQTIPKSNFGASKTTFSDHSESVNCSTLGARALLQSLPDHRSARASEAFPSSCSSRSLRSKRKPAKASAAWPVAGPLCARKDVR